MGDSQHEAHGEKVQSQACLSRPAVSFLLPAQAATRMFSIRSNLLTLDYVPLKSVTTKDNEGSIYFLRNHCFGCKIPCFHSSSL